MKAIETKKLTKIYNNKEVVNNINLSIDEGKVFGFLGKNGAGKSTFINMITDLCRPTRGEYQLNVSRGKRDIGVLPDYSSFYDNLTGEAHLKYFCNILKIKITKKEISNLFDSVGLSDGLNLKVKKYSFGMKKKLGIAQAVVNKPKVLFLDEPTSGVDANSILTIHNLIIDIAKKGTTVFLTSHNLDEIEKLCDEIAIMDNGKIIKQGNVEKLKKDYEDNLSISIKHREINQSEREVLLKEFQNLKFDTSNFEFQKNITHIDVSNENNIPLLIKIYVTLNIDIYGVNTYEPSLEEIFINSSSNSIDRL